MNLHHLSKFPSSAIATILNQCLIGVFDYKFSGSFHKKYNGSISSMLQEKDHYWTVVLNENSLYDFLPEGLFHQPQIGVEKNTKQYVSEHIRYKEEERAARLFFAPFDEFILGAKVNINLLSERWRSQLHEDELAIQAALYDLSWALSKPHLAVLISVLNEVNNHTSATSKLELLIHRLYNLEAKVTACTSVYFPTEYCHDILLGFNSILSQDSGVALNQWRVCIQLESIATYEEYQNDVQKKEILAIATDRWLPLGTELVWQWETNNIEAAIESSYLNVNII